MGIGLAQLFPGCKVTLSDLSEVLEILDYNISSARVAHGSELAKLTLDWNCELPSAVQKTVFSLILISDCTYNCDSLSALVATLSALVSLSPNLHVLVSMKVRHSSEAVFFDLMAGSGFYIIEHMSIALPDKYREKVGLELEIIEIYIFDHTTVFPCLEAMSNER